MNVTVDWSKFPNIAVWEREIILEAIEQNGITQDQIDNATEGLL